MLNAVENIILVTYILKFQLKYYFGTPFNKSSKVNVISLK